MKEIYILRHAKSSWDNINLADFDRPLAKKGIDDAKKLCSFLKKHKFNAAKVICSNAKRAKETFDLTADGFQFLIDDATYTDELYFGNIDTVIEKIKETEEELKKGIFTMDSYLAQLRQMKKMGGMEGVMSMLPGVNKMKSKMDQANIDEKMLVENEAIILSMTQREKENPKIISGSRRKRIANGSGVDVSKINKLLKQFKMMSDMMKKMSQGKKIPSGMIPDEMLYQLK